MEKVNRILSFPRTWMDRWLLLAMFYFLFPIILSPRKKFTSTVHLYDFYCFFTWLSLLCGFTVAYSWLQMACTSDTYRNVDRKDIYNHHLILFTIRSQYITLYVLSMAYRQWWIITYFQALNNLKKRVEDDISMTIITSLSKVYSVVKPVSPYVSV